MDSSIAANTICLTGYKCLLLVSVDYPKNGLRTKFNIRLSKLGEIKNKTNLTRLALYLLVHNICRKATIKIKSKTKTINL